MTNRTVKAARGGAQGVVTNRQRWRDAADVRARRQAIDNVEQRLADALRLLAELRETDVWAANDFERFDLTWQLDATLHAAIYPLFKLVNDERAAHWRSAS